MFKTFDSHVRILQCIWWSLRQINANFCTGCAQSVIFFWIGTFLHNSKKYSATLENSGNWCNGYNSCCQLPKIQVRCQWVHLLKISVANIFLIAENDSYWIVAMNLFCRISGFYFFVPFLDETFVLKHDFIFFCLQSNFGIMTILQYQHISSLVWDFCWRWKNWVCSWTETKYYVEWKIGDSFKRSASSTCQLFQNWRMTR